MWSQGFNPSWAPHLNFEERLIDGGVGALQLTPAVHVERRLQLRAQRRHLALLLAATMLVGQGTIRVFKQGIGPASVCREALHTKMHCCWRVLWLHKVLEVDRDASSSRTVGCVADLQQLAAQAVAVVLQGAHVARGGGGNVQLPLQVGDADGRHPDLGHAARPPVRCERRYAASRQGVLGGQHICLQKCRWRERRARTSFWRSRYCASPRLSADCCSRTCPGHVQAFMKDASAATAMVAASCMKDHS